MSYLSVPQAAIAYVSSFADTCFVLITSVTFRIVHSVTLCPVESISGPSKELFSIVYSTCLSLYRVKNSFGGPGGIRTRVQNTFLFASYDHNSLQVRSLYIFPSLVMISFHSVHTVLGDCNTTGGC